MDIKELQKFIEENKDSEEVKALFPKPKLDDFLETEDFQKLVKSAADKEARRQVLAFEQNTLPLKVEEEIKKRSSKTPEQIKFEEYEKKLSDMQNKLMEKERAELVAKNKAVALSKLSEKGLPTSLVDFFISDQEDKTLDNINQVTKVFEDYGQQLKQAQLKGNNTQVPGKETSQVNTTNVPGENATEADWEKYYKSNPGALGVK